MPGYRLTQTALLGDPYSSDNGFDRLISGYRLTQTTLMGDPCSSDSDFDRLI